MKTHQITSHDMTWHLATNHIPSPRVISQPTTKFRISPGNQPHQNRSPHHHHGTAEGSFTQKTRFGHRSGWSPCAHSIGKFFLWLIGVFFGNFRPRLARLYLYQQVVKTFGVGPWRSRSRCCLQRLLVASQLLLLSRCICWWVCSVGLLTLKSIVLLHRHLVLMFVDLHLWVLLLLLHCSWVVLCSLRAVVPCMLWTCASNPRTYCSHHRRVVGPVCTCVCL